MAADPGVLQLLFRSVDALGAGVEAAARGSDAAVEPELAAELDRTAGGQGTGAPAAATPESGRVRAVEVTLRREAVMRGARASLILARLEPLGAVSGLRPPAAAFERDEFDGRFAFRLATSATDGDIERIIRRTGEVALVSVGDPVDVAETAERARQIRVDLARLDALMKQVGELVVAKNRLAAIAVGAGDSDLAEVSDRVTRLVASMQAEVLAARMTPVGEVFERFPRLVRDLARDLGKRIRFDAEGEDIELDRSVLDEIGEPLLHLIRNAADHGIERPEVRAAEGKPEEGRILLSAARERNSVALRVSDDGRGIDRAGDPGEGPAGGVGRRDHRNPERRPPAPGAGPAGIQHGGGGERGLGAGRRRGRRHDPGAGARRHPGSAERAGTGHHLHGAGAAHARDRAGAAGPGRRGALRRAAGVRGGDGGVRPPGGDVRAGPGGAPGARSGGAHGAPPRPGPGRWAARPPRGRRP